MPARPDCAKPSIGPEFVRVAVSMLVLTLLPAGLRGQDRPVPTRRTAAVKADAERIAPAAGQRADRPQVGRAWTVPEANLELVPIPAGNFLMGSPRGERARGDYELQVRVTLTQPYWLGRTEVTQRQWESVMGNNPSALRGADLPVETVTWDDAVAFCRKLTQRERAAGRLPAGHEYTLPTEAQWEYACRAGTTGAYAGNVEAMAWHRDNSGTSTHAVGGKEANAWGLFDMHGNVFEWCLDWYADYPRGRVTDPKGPAAGSARVARGGSWYVATTFCRSASRGNFSPGDSYHSLGFRVALSPVP